MNAAAPDGDDRAPLGCRARRPRPAGRARQGGRERQSHDAARCRAALARGPERQRRRCRPAARRRRRSQHDDGRRRNRADDRGTGWTASKRFAACSPPAPTVGARRRYRADRADVGGLTQQRGRGAPARRGRRRHQGPNGTCRPIAAPGSGRDRRAGAGHQLRRRPVDVQQPASDRVHGVPVRRARRRHRRRQGAPRCRRERQRHAVRRFERARRRGGKRALGAGEPAARPRRRSRTWRQRAGRRCIRQFGSAVRTSASARPGRFRPVPSTASR